MQFTVSVTRRKVNNTIVETFFINPKHQYLIDYKRKAARFIWKFIVRTSIADKYELLNIIWDDFNVTLIMAFKDIPIDFKLSEIFKFHYAPVLGEKRCTKCVALKIFNNKMYCRIKSKKINKNSWYKCQEWIENTLIERI